MIVYEFYLKGEFKDQAFDELCDAFYKIPNPVSRKVDGVKGSAVYSVSRNMDTNWVQLLVDDNTPAGIITAIEARISSLQDETFIKYTNSQDNVAPQERPRKRIGVS